MKFESNPSKILIRQAVITQSLDRPRVAPFLRILGLGSDWTLVLGGSVHKSMRNLVGRVDSNHRPPGPEPAFINNLQTSFTENTRLTHLRLGPYLDPKGEAWRTGRLLDPAWTLVSTLAIRSSAGTKLTGSVTSCAGRPEGWVLSTDRRLRPVHRARR